MYWKNLMIGMKKSNIPIIIKSLKLNIKQCYLTVWSVEKTQKVKIRKLYRQKNRKNKAFMKIGSLQVKI